ncbi:MAG: type I pullulanase [Firmicutes bacterium]|nr:type I pullulanase [Bacillota bacterium]
MDYYGYETTDLPVSMQYNSKEFEFQYRYDGNDLGNNYRRESTTWNVWSPLAAKITLCLYATGSDQETGARSMGEFPLLQGVRGIWNLTLAGDYANVYYTYRVHLPYREAREIPDPYARACGVNGGRSMVLNPDDAVPEGWAEDRRPVLQDPTDAVIWEVHVRDFSWGPDSGMIHKGKFLAFTEDSTHVPEHPELPTGTAYLKQLGITHVQLLPVMDFESVDECDPCKNYNWGYDPLHYFIPEGSYSTDPYHGAVRIRECRQMIQSLHKAGIGVILDVVYNHTYRLQGSIFDTLMPGYYYRYWGDGTPANGSGCGNEIASERGMVRNLILSSLRYWAEEYHVDGFRFDLMGLIDTETIRQAREMLDSLPDGRQILMYGEPWAAQPPHMNEGSVPADKSHIAQIPDRVGIFNDETRDAVKGNNFDMYSTGFINGAWFLESKIENSLKGWAGPYNTVRQPTQTISYVSAHDNFTLWDKLVYGNGTAPEAFHIPDADALDSNRLAAVIYLLAQGIPFMQAGEEFARTKEGDGNSYASPSSVNALEWKRCGMFGQLAAYYQGLIQIRKAFHPFHDASCNAIRNMVFSEQQALSVAFTVPGTEEDEWEMAAVLLNASTKDQMIRLKSWNDHPMPERWAVIADRTRAGLVPLRYVHGPEISVHGRSALVLVSVKESE